MTNGPFNRCRDALIRNRTATRRRRRPGWEKHGQKINCSVGIWWPAFQLSPSLPGLNVLNYNET